MGIMGVQTPTVLYYCKWRCAAQGRGRGRVLEPGRRSAPRALFTRRIHSLSDEASPTLSPLPSPPLPSLATRTAALESSEAMLITREITRHFQPGNTVSAAMASLWPLLFARFKTWLLQTCWKTQTVIWRLFLTRES